MSENKFDIMQFTEILKDKNFSYYISIKDIKLNDKDYLNKKFGIKRYLFNNILDSIETINFAFSSKIDFDYEVKKIYKEKSYDSLEECIKDVEFPKNSDGIYADEKDFRSAFKDTKYIKKLTLDLKSTDELYKYNFSSLIVIFHVNKDVSLFEVTNIMDKLYLNLPKETKIIFGSEVCDIPKEEQRVEFYFDDTKREALDKFKSDFGTLASNKNLKKLNIDRFINYENEMSIRV